MSPQINGAYIFNDRDSTQDNTVIIKSSSYGVDFNYNLATNYNFYIQHIEKYCNTKCDLPGLISS